MDRFQYPYFHSKAPDFLAEFLLNKGTLIKHKKNKTLALADEKPTNIYYIKTGACILKECSSSGTCKVIGILLPGGTYGEPYFMDDYNRADFTAITDMEILSIPGNEVVKHIQNYPYKIKRLLGFVMDKVNYFEHIRLNMIEYNIVQRFAMLLKSYVQYTSTSPNKDNYFTFDIKLTQELLANILHTSRSSVSLIISLLTKKGLIKYENKIVLFSSKILEDKVIFNDLENVHWDDIRKK